MGAMQEIANSKGRKQKGDRKNTHLRKKGQDGKLVYFTGDNEEEGTTVFLEEILFDTYNIIIIIII